MIAAGIHALLALAAGQQADVYDFGRARAVIDSVLVADKIPSVAVAVAKGDRILWEAGVGYADVEKHEPATSHTPYSLASISKPFTATGIMVLVQQGFVRLRAPVNDYLGGVRVAAREGNAKDITVERILTHRAGLPLHYQFFYNDAGYSRPSMDSTIRRYAVAVYPPGEAYQYSNLGFGILDYVISRKSRMSYAEFMRREVFMPLGLTNTSVAAPVGPASRVAQRYDADNKPLPYYTFDHPGASEVYSSAHDLVRFGMFHLGFGTGGRKQILARETVQEMQRDKVPGEPAGTARGLGWSIDQTLGVRRVSHSGGMPGVSTFLALYPSEQVVVVVLVNKSVRSATSAIVTELTAAMIPQFATELRARRASPTPPVAPDTAGLARLHGTWRGFIHTYADSVAMRLTLAPEGRSRVSLNGAAEVPLSNVALQQGAVTATSLIRLSAPDIARHEHRTGFWLRLHDGVLSGYAAAQTSTPRVYYALSSYVRLERELP